MSLLRSQVASIVRQEAAKYADQMLRVQVDIALDEKQAASDRLRASGMVLDRAAGKATQEIADENFNPDVVADKIRTAAESARDMLVAVPSGDGKVVPLRPTPPAPPRRKVERRRFTG